jgi:hypothetical protein
VSVVLKILAERGYTVLDYRYDVGNETTSPRTVPSTWLVSDGFLVQSKKVVLVVTPPKG